MKPLLAPIFCALLVSLSAFAGPSKAPTVTLISPKDLQKKIQKQLDKPEPDVIVLDARTSDKFEAGHLPDALSMSWVDFSEMPKSPKLRSIPELDELLQSKGISTSKPIVVYGDGKDGWGEEGRLFWTLSYLGHKNVSVLDGGLPAWKKDGYVVDTVGPPLLSGKFAVKVQHSMRIDLKDLKKALESKSTQLLDVRDKEEFDGAKKFGEPRGGHLPGAKNLPWKQLIDGEGKLKSKAELAKIFEGAGLKKDKPVIVYCTGGVRSGFAFMALSAAGYQAMNYDGSFWEWAADATLPLEGPKT